MTDLSGKRPMTGTSYAQEDEDMRILILLYYELMILKRFPEELAQHPAFRSHLENNMDYDGKGHLYGRHYTFLQECPG